MIREKQTEHTCEDIQWQKEYTTAKALPWNGQLNITGELGWGGVGEGGQNRFYVATTFALSSAVVYPRHVLSPREGLLTVQYIRENKKKSNEYRDETTMRTRQQEVIEMLKQKKTNSGTPMGLTKARVSGTNRLPKRL